MDQFPRVLELINHNMIKLKFRTNIQWGRNSIMEVHCKNQLVKVLVQEDMSPNITLNMMDILNLVLVKEKAFATRNWLNQSQVLFNINKMLNVFKIRLQIIDLEQKNRDLKHQRKFL